VTNDVLIVGRPGDAVARRLERALTARGHTATWLDGPTAARLFTIRVTAAGVNFGDISQAYGTFLGGPRPPYLAGFEGAGEVAAAGEAVTGLEAGARVVGVGYGAFAEYIAVPAAMFCFWLAYFCIQLKARPLLQVNDPHLPEILEPEHVHA